MYNPVSTYRIQFHKEFNFSDFEKIIPYLHDLGVKTIYASPIFAAMPGSMHGYDGIDPNEIDPEIGTLEQFKNIAKKLSELGMGWIQDFVPNHMAYSTKNPWIFDLFEKGNSSSYRSFFDCDLPILLPVLGNHLEEAVKENQVFVSFENGRLWLNHSESQYPLNLCAYEKVFSKIESNKALVELITTIKDLLACKSRDELEAGWKRVLDLASHMQKDKKTVAALDAAIAKINSNPEALLQLIQSQYYLPCYWKELNEHINYRRFFTVKTLICLNMELPHVFDEYHKLLALLVRQNYIQGVRLDHIDGLADPATYLRRLRELLGVDVYIIVEKILGEGENLPEEWLIEGNTGYDFMTAVNKVLINPEAEIPLTDFYKTIADNIKPIKQQLLDSKAQILYNNMRGELDNISSLFLALPDLELPEGIDFEAVQKFLAALLLHCPFYRYYPKSVPLEEKDLDDFTGWLELFSLEDENLKAFKQFFRDQFIDGNFSAASRKKRLEFLRRCMQYTGVLKAKGLEDTLMYRYNRFLGHNEVGGDFDEFAISNQDFYKRMKARQERSPLSLNGTATHDAKRGEDVRARLQALSFEAGKWKNFMEKWLADLSYKGENPTRNDRYFLLQTLLGSLPFQEMENYMERISAYITKAEREAKNHSSWGDPDEAYEQALIDYANNIYDFDISVGSEMRHLISSDKDEIILNSLVQVALKFLCPGIPDVYQGTEFWDLSFVDPDNRRPVDYDQLKKSLKEIKAGVIPKSLLDNPDDAKIKLWLLHELFHLRKRKFLLFENGDFEPFHFHGEENFVSFYRNFGAQRVLVLLPKGGKIELPEQSMISLPAERWRNVLTGEELNGEISLQAQLDSFPMLILETIGNAKNRVAGVLLPLFSLNSDFGIGSMGKEAFQFVRFLKENGQKAWQILPLNPIVKKNSFSPYAAISSFACEPLYIDLEKLVEHGWLDAKDVDAARIENTGRVEYERAVEIKEPLFRKAWQNFKQENGNCEERFESFCRKANWLHDYCLFLVAKKENDDKPWYEWPPEIANREEGALENFTLRHKDELDYQKWLQFVFAEQWNELKGFCEQSDVRIVGDLPFYVSADSADIWVKRELVHLNEVGEITQMAGVPPDYFNADGQLWGMPTYRWSVMEATGFSWWMERLKRSTEIYHFVRLDHFRAFYDYWEVPQGVATAKEGVWKEGPKDKLFDKILEAFPDMPFIAEDLGDIHQGIYDFVEKWKLRGMRVLQFGFDGDMANRNLPHNFVSNCVVYTGTHDNNTTLGWFRNLDAATKKAFEAYVGHSINDSNCVEEMIGLAYDSAADWVIIPFMDWLGLGEEARINTPATGDGNWGWRVVVML